MNNILPATPENIKKAATLIKKGSLVAFPTETVYGLGADALNPSAVVKIFEVKQRPKFNPLIVHVADISLAEKLCVIDKKAKLLMKHFWPGPLTLVLPKKEIVPDIVTAGLLTVAIRMPAHPVALELIKESQTAIAAPSANLSGRISPTTAQEVAEQLDKKVDLILDGGKCPIGIESTVLAISPKPVILRLGGIPVEDIEKVIGKIEISTSKKRPLSPGQLLRHYSPKTPLKIIKDKKDIKIPKNLKAGLLALKPPDDEFKKLFIKIKVLSQTGDLKEAAKNLFSYLNSLDKEGLDIIYAEAPPQVGLGRAILDRLKRAETKNDSI